MSNLYRKNPFNGKAQVMCPRGTWHNIGVLCKCDETAARVLKELTVADMQHYARRWGSHVQAKVASYARGPQLGTPGEVRIVVQVPPGVDNVTIAVETWKDNA